MNMIDHVLQEHYDEFELSSCGLGRRFETVLLTPQFTTSRHVVALVFNQGRPDPLLVVKVPRQPGDNEGVLREANMLREFAALSEGHVAGVPEVVGTVQVGSQTVLIETAISGVPLDPPRVAADRAAAIESGSRFVDALPTTRPAEANVDWYDRNITLPLEALTQLTHGNGEVAALRDRSHHILRPLQSLSLPAVFEHADLSHPNLFVLPDGRLQAVDWERSTTGGVPGHDLVFFLQYVSESAASAFTIRRQIAAFDDAFGSRGWATSVLREHLSRRGVDSDLLPLLVVATWARSAATLADRLGHLEPSGRSDVAQRSAAVTADRDFWLWRHAIEVTSGSR
jgi:Phosphotransferase enzyme family